MYGRHHVANGGSSIGGVSRCSLFVLSFSCSYCLFFKHSPVRVWRFSGRCRPLTILRFLFKWKLMFVRRRKKKGGDNYFFSTWDDKSLRTIMMVMATSVFFVGKHRQLKSKQKWTWDIFQSLQIILQIFIFHRLSY